MAQESAIALERVKNNHFGEAYIFEINEWDTTMHHAIDLYAWWFPLAMNNAGMDSCHRCDVISGHSTTLMILTKKHTEMWTTCHIACWQSLVVEIRRNWCARLGSGGNGLILFLSSGMEESNQLGVPVFCLFSSLFDTSWLLWILAKYKWHQHGNLPPADHSQVEVEFPCAQDPPKGYCMVPIRRRTYEFLRIRLRHDWLILPYLSFPFL